MGEQEEEKDGRREKRIRIEGWKDDGGWGSKGTMEGGKRESEMKDRRIRRMGSRRKTGRKEERENQN